MCRQFVDQGVSKGITKTNNEKTNLVAIFLLEEQTKKDLENEVKQSDLIEESFKMNPSINSNTVTTLRRRRDGRPGLSER